MPIDIFLQRAEISKTADPTLHFHLRKDQRGCINQAEDLPLLIQYLDRQWDENRGIRRWLTAIIEASIKDLYHGNRVAQQTARAWFEDTTFTFEPLPRNCKRGMRRVGERGISFAACCVLTGKNPSTIRNKILNLTPAEVKEYLGNKRGRKPKAFHLDVLEAA